LNALSKFIPKAISQLGAKVNILADDRELERINSTTLVYVATNIKLFVEAFSIEDRMFFEHFVVHASTLAASKSILVEHFLDRERAQQPEGQGWVTQQQLILSLVKVAGKISRLLRLGSENHSTLEELTEAAQALQAADRSPAAELILLLDFFEAESVIPIYKLVLVPLSDPLQKGSRLMQIDPGFPASAVRIQEVPERSPAWGLVFPGDELSFVHGEAATDRQPVQDYLSSLVPGVRELMLTVRVCPPKALGCNNIEDAAAIVTDLAQALELHGLRDPLVRLVGNDEGQSGTLQRLNFACTGVDQADVEFEQLRNLAYELCSADGVWTAEECSTKLMRIRSLLCPGHNTESDLHRYALKGILSLFEYLAGAIKVWEFVEGHPEFIAHDGIGYSHLFEEKVEEFLTDLGGEDHKVLLGFQPVVQWVAVLVSFHKQPFNKLMRAICDSSGIMKHACRPIERQPFHELSIAESNMEFLADLFTTGLGGLDRVIGQFCSIAAGCTYVFDLELSKLLISYIDSKKQHTTELSHDMVLDFEQRLGFVQHEEQARQHHIDEYLMQLQEYRRLLTLMRELHVLGHQSWAPRYHLLLMHNYTNGASAGDNTVPEDEQQPEGQERVVNPTPAMVGDQPNRHLRVEDLIALEQTLTMWKEKLDSVSKDNEFLCFFSLATARRIDKLIAQNASYELALLICPLLPRFLENFNNLLIACKRQLSARNFAEHSESSQSGAARVAPDWPDRAASLLKDVFGALEGDQTVRAVYEKGGTIETVQLNRRAEAKVLGPKRYSAQTSHPTLLRLLLVIFGAQPPLPYQILWCHPQTTARSLHAFVERTRLKETQQFVLLQVDQLRKGLQYDLLNLLLRTREQPDAALSNLHIIETGRCVLQSATWILPQDTDGICAKVDLKMGLKRWAYSDSCMASEGLKCFCGPPGSGKTYQLRHQIRSLGSDVDSYTVSITEAFCLKDVTRELHGKALQSIGRKIALCFHLNIGKFKDTEIAEWTCLMERISRFFFDLVILKSVEDPESGQLFNVPPGSELQVFVELPDRHSHLDEHDVKFASRQAKFDTDIPVLAAVGCFVDASTKPFDVTPEALHVAKYLMSYENGTIDQLYGGGGTKNSVMFVLDDSGSMNNGRLEICKKCIQQQICATRLKEGDHAGLTLLNTRSSEVPLGPWGEHHRELLNQQLQQVHADNGTPLWEAFQRAVNVCLQHDHGSRVPWIIALTDGQANTPVPDSLYQRLRTTDAGRKLRVLFITVGLPSNSETFRDIHRVCVRGRGEGNDIIPADGGLAAVEHAWSTVGDRLTVSQRIEKQGASVTHDECVRLLRKYMRLNEHSSWSRLQQTFWIKYLHRRCGILASSEKFNKNKSLAKFGSTTMRVMLQEVELALSNDII